VARKPRCFTVDRALILILSHSNGFRSLYEVGRPGPWQAKCRKHDRIQNRESDASKPFVIYKQYQQIDTNMHNFNTIIQKGQAGNIQY